MSVRPCAVASHVSRPGRQLTTIADLRNTTLRRRHWESIERLLGHQVLDLDEQTPLTLQLLIDYQAFHKAEQIKEISGQASSEASLETLLGKVGGHGGWWAVERAGVLT